MSDGRSPENTPENALQLNRAHWNDRADMRADDGLWRFPAGRRAIPLAFSLLATKP